jgi:putative ABC transport system permease protein
VNETAVRRLGYKSPRDAIGHHLINPGDKQSVVIIGVVKDYYFELFVDRIYPLALRYIPSEFRHLNIRISGTDTRSTLAGLEKTWEKMDKKHVFNYSFYDQQIANTNAIFGDVISIIGFISIMVISISAMGLLGIATYAVEKKRKEIGIRKVLGANVNKIIIFLSKGYFYMLLIASAIAVPLGYVINNFWLNTFAYRISLAPSIFLSGILLVFVIGILTIGSQTYRAANSDPASILRDE